MHCVICISPVIKQHTPIKLHPKQTGAYRDMIRYVCMRKTSHHLKASISIMYTCGTRSVIKHAMDKRKWQFMSVVRDTILDHRGVIFGGYVRDLIIHDHFANAFYEVVASSPSAYNNPLFMKDAWDRTLIPNDIDFRIKETDLTALMTAFERKHITTRVEFMRDPRNYIGHVNMSDPTLKHIRMYVSIDMTKVNSAFNELPIRMNSRHNRAPSIKLDIFSSQHRFSEPFIAHPDFECNALYMTPHGFSVSSFVSKKDHAYNDELLKQRIISNIIKRDTKYLNPDPDSEMATRTMIYRVDRMLRSNWMIEDDIIRTVKDRRYTGHCIICHGDLDEVHFKLHCCDSRYHALCLQKAMTRGEKAMRFTNQCIMCQKDITSSETNLPYLLSKCGYCAEVA